MHQPSTINQDPHQIGLYTPLITLHQDHKAKTATVVMRQTIDIHLQRVAA